MSLWPLIWSIQWMGKLITVLCAELVFYSEHIPQQAMNKLVKVYIETQIINLCMSRLSREMLLEIIINMLNKCNE